MCFRSEMKLFFLAFIFVSPQTQHSEVYQTIDKNSPNYNIFVQYNHEKAEIQK